MTKLAVALAIALSPKVSDTWAICPVSCSCYQSPRKGTLTPPNGRHLPSASLCELGLTADVQTHVVLQLTNGVSSGCFNFVNLNKNKAMHFVDIAGASSLSLYLFLAECFSPICL